MSKPLSGIPTRYMRIVNLIRKELDFLSKEKLSVGILFILPVIIISVAALVEPPTFKEPDPVWIFDYDNTDLSEELIDVFRNESTTFQVISTHDDPNLNFGKGMTLLPTEGLSAIIIIPEDFEQNIIDNGTTSITIYIDGYDVTAQLTIQGAMTSTLIAFQLEHGNFESDVFFFPEFQPEVTDDLLRLSAPMLVSLSLFASMNLIASQSIVGDMPLKRLLTTPAHRFEIVIAKTLSYGAIAFIQTLIALFFVDFVYGGVTYLRSVFVDLFIVTYLGALGGVTIGILFSIIAETRLQAAQYFLFFFMIGLVMTLKLRIGLILTFFPFEHASVAFTKIGFRGALIQDCAQQLINFAISIGSSFLLCIFLFTRKKELV